MVNIAVAQIQLKDITGAWQTSGETIQTKIYADHFFSIAEYDLTGKKFISTAGGKWKLEGDHLIETFEYNTAHPELVGTDSHVVAELKNKNLVINNIHWAKVDDGKPGSLAGAWLITSRKVNNDMQTINAGPRRTMKILSGTRFQWIAYNVETKEFMGTGGGTYTTENGKYTEHIEFFSRDNGRVGSTLIFDFELKDGNWHHTGLSSKGDPIDEVWTKREKTGL